MLVLSRKRFESVLIPDLGIEICVVDIRSDKIRLGITAPTELKFYRREVWERIQQMIADDLRSAVDAEQDSAAAA